MDELTLTQRLDEGDERLLAHELLLVDQTCQLIALQALVRQLIIPWSVDVGALERDIAQLAAPYASRFESIGGVIERTRRIALALQQSDPPM